MILILGIESSCDETAVAIIRENDDSSVDILTNIISSQEHGEYGGVVPELAARSHLNNIRLVASRAFEEAGIQKSEIDGVAAAYGPGLVGGLLIGNLFGKMISSIFKKPFIAINHVESHVLTPLLNNPKIKYPLLAVLISGGHTQIVLAKAFETYEFIGKTLDDSLGETFDKVGMMLGMQYPAGPLIEKAALHGNQKAFKLPTPLCFGEYKDSANFSFSGLKTHVKLLVEKQNILSDDFIADVAASFQYTILQILTNKIQNAIKSCNTKLTDIIVSGGVSANNYLKVGLKKVFQEYHLHFPNLNLATDNGVMIAWNGLLKYKRGYFDTLDSRVLARIW